MVTGDRWWKFLSEMGKLKSVMGEPVYRAALVDCGYKKANLVRKNIDEMARAWRYVKRKKDNLDQLSDEQVEVVGVVCGVFG